MNFDIPTGSEKPSWAGLFGAVPMLYVFVSPYEGQAGIGEWLWTSLAFILFLILNILGAIYWSRPAIMQRVCLALAVLAVVFTAYRPSGVFFFVLTGAFVPLATGGNLNRSFFILAGIVILILLQWQLFWPIDTTPFIVAGLTAIVGAAITVLTRQQNSIARFHKVVERERIARDLHDILGHTISVIILKSELAGKLIDKDLVRARKEIGEIENIARSTLKEIREALAGYRTGDLQNEIQLISSTLRTADIEFVADFEPCPMTLAQERVIALVLREITTNILRHSQATQCRLSIQQRNNTCQIVMQDNGSGGLLEEGLGIKGIKERIDSIDGKVVWDNEAGTRVTMTIPVSTSEQG